VAGVLLADRSGDYISVHILPLVGDPVVASTYSWGSAILAWLYKVMGRAVFFTGGSLRGTGDIGGFTLLVQLWALERFPRIVELYIKGGNPPVDDSAPSGVRWLLIIEHHQHRVAMRLEDIHYALDRCTNFVVRLLIPYISLSQVFQFLTFSLQYQCFPHTFQWMSYAERTEDYALQKDVLWRVVTPMLCIDYIAWHHFDRCIWQFGFDHRVP
ncbi:Serine/threonine-protein phosphatase 7 long form homolog, partial [Linum perenne]